MGDVKDRFTLVIPIYDQYELFRQCFESVLYNINVKQGLVIDDYSDPNSKLREYENYIENKYSAVKVIKSDEYRLCFHCKEQDQLVGEKMGWLDKSKLAPGSSRGHQYALQCGIDNTETEFVVCVDADCVFLEKSKYMLNEIAELFDKNPNVMCMGQVAGLMSNKWETVNKKFDFKYAGSTNPNGGCPGSPIFACRMSGWKEHGIRSITDHPTGSGWALVFYYQDVFEKGFEIGNYPFMSDKKVFHIGGGIFSFARFARRQYNLLGMCNDQPRYGGRIGLNTNTEWYHGRYILDMSSHQYINYLQDKYSNPFEQIQPKLDENLLYIAKEEIKQ